MFRALICVLTAVAFCCSPARGDEIFDNGLDLSLANFASFSFTGTTTGAQYQIADDFNLGAGTNWEVDGLQFTGLLYDSGSFQQTRGEQLVFDVMILADQAGAPTGTPLDPVPGTSIAWRQASAIGTDPGVFNNVARFTLSFDPITLAGGTDFWLIISARDEFSYIESLNNGTAFAWLGRNATGNAWQGGTNFQNDWFFQGRQQDFQLLGSAIPEPGSFMALTTAFACVVLRRRK